MVFGGSEALDGSSEALDSSSEALHSSSEALDRSSEALDSSSEAFDRRSWRKKAFEPPPVVRIRMHSKCPRIAFQVLSKRSAQPSEPRKS